MNQSRYDFQIIENDYFFQKLIHENPDSHSDVHERHLICFRGNLRDEDNRIAMNEFLVKDPTRT